MLKSKNIDLNGYTLKMAALVAIFCANGCRQPSAINAQKQRDAYFTKSIYPEARNMVATGDIVVRSGTDLTSLLFSELNTGNCKYSHCGIASIENDSAWVYHTIGGEFNPGGKMKREPLYSFASPGVCSALGIFSPGLNSTQVNTMINRVQAQYYSGLRFDMDFDLATDEKQYCTEMVAKNISGAAGDTMWINVIHTGRFRYIPVASLIQNKMVKEKIQFQY